MPRNCTVCTHADIIAIDLDLVTRVGYRTIATRYAVSESALKRHMKEHIPEVLVKGREAEEVAHADDLLAELRSEKTDIQRLKDLAESGEDYRTALLAVDKALKALELQAKVAQLIDASPQVNILINPQWTTIRETIVEALDPYPEARQTVAAALMALEDNGRSR